MSQRSINNCWFIRWPQFYLYKFSPCVNSTFRPETKLFVFGTKALCSAFPCARHKSSFALTHGGIGAKCAVKSGRLGCSGTLSLSPSHYDYDRTESRARNSINLNCNALLKISKVKWRCGDDLKSTFPRAHTHTLSLTSALISRRAISLWALQVA